MRAFFYDTWAFLGLANAADPHHELRAGVDETLTGLHVAAGARVTLAFLDTLLARIEGGDLLLVEIATDRRSHALAPFRRLTPDTPRLSFTDCTSFAAMRGLGIEHRGVLKMRPLPS